jgi:hypothetical protein
MGHPLPAPTPACDPLVTDLVEALRYYRGVGHRRLVIAHVVAARRAAGEAVTADAVLACFEGNTGVGPGDPRPFRLPFGRGTQRWALSEALEEN